MTRKVLGRKARVRLRDPSEQLACCWVGAAVKAGVGRPDHSCVAVLSVHVPRPSGQATSG